MSRASAFRVLDDPDRSTADGIPRQGSRRSAADPRPAAPHQQGCGAEVVCEGEIVGVTGGRARCSTEAGAHGEARTRLAARWPSPRPTGAVRQARSRPASTARPQATRRRRAGGSARSPSICRRTTAGASTRSAARSPPARRFEAGVHEDRLKAPVETAGLVVRREARASSADRCPACSIRTAAAATRPAEMTDLVGFVFFVEGLAVCSLLIVLWFSTRPHTSRARRVALSGSGSLPAGNRVHDKLPDWSPPDDRLAAADGRGRPARPHGDRRARIGKLRGSRQGLVGRQRPRP
jgi:hypothetical protein